MRAGLAFVGIGMLVVAGLLLANTDPSQDLLGLDHERFASLSAFVALLIVFGAGFMAGPRFRLGEAVRALVLWAAFGVVLIGLYTHRQDLSEIAERTLGAVVPGMPVVTRTGEITEITLNRGLDHHFLARGRVNGARALFLVDTGASRVTLSAETARAAKLPLDKMDFSTPVRTANGVANVAPVRIASLDIGPAHFTNVDAFVAPEGALDFDLLGVSALDRLESFEVRGDEMILRLHAGS